MNTTTRLNETEVNKQMDCILFSEHLFLIEFNLKIIDVGIILYYIYILHNNQMNYV